MISAVSRNRSTFPLDKVAIPRNKKDVVPRQALVGSKVSPSDNRGIGSYESKAKETAKRRGDWTHDAQEKRQRDLRAERLWRSSEAVGEEAFLREARASACGRMIEQNACVEETDEEEVTGLEGEDGEEGCAWAASHSAFGFGSAILYTDPSSSVSRHSPKSVARKDDSVMKKFSRPIDFDADYDGTKSENIDFDTMFAHGEDWPKSWTGSLF